MNNVSIVVPVWNGKKLLEKNLPTWIAAKENTKNNIAEIVLVDDKSTDDTVKFLKKEYQKDIRLICHKSNRGFSSAVNTGFRSASSSLICLINQDVAVSPDFLLPVLKHFESSRVFGVSFHEKGYAYAKGEFKNGFIIHSPGREVNKTMRTFWISGGSGVFRRSIWMKLGGFDESLLSPFYWEDVDISYRALKRGLKLLWEPRAHVIHDHEAVINKNNFKMWWLNLIKERNYLLFNWKNLTSHNLMKKHRIGLIKRIRSHPGYLKVVIMACIKMPKVLKARTKEKKEAIVSDEAIFSSFDR